jgi:hypothetical protein
MTCFSNDIEKCVIKSTYSDNKLPKEKHIRRLIDYSVEQKLSKLLNQRLAIGSLNGVIKTLIVIHRLCSDSDIFIKDFSKNGVLDIKETHKSDFLHKYASYLKEKINVYKNSTITDKNNIEAYPQFKYKKIIQDIDGSNLAKTLSQLSNQFDTLLLCVNNNNDKSDNLEIINMAFSILIKDAIRIYTMISTLILCIHEHYSLVNRRQKDILIDCCDRFRKQTLKFKKWVNLIYNYSNNVSPTLGQHILSEVLQGHIDTISKEAIKVHPETITVESVAKTFMSAAKKTFLYEEPYIDKKTYRDKPLRTKKKYYNDDDLEENEDLEAIEDLEASEDIRRLEAVDLKVEKVNKKRFETEEPLPKLTRSKSMTKIK